MRGTFGLTLDTFAEFPAAAYLNYKIEVYDRAGNITTYSNGNLVNFSVMTKISCFSSKSCDFRTGDMGVVKAITIGYVPRIQLDFGSVGAEMVSEINDGKVPEKYNLGVDTPDNKTKRIIGSAQATKIDAGKADYNGVAYASYYTGINDIDSSLPEYCTDNDIAKLDGWQTNGTLIRIPPYYSLTPSGELKSDKTDAYKTDAEEYTVYALKNSSPECRVSATGKYNIYDSGKTAVHYRITHET